ncbi:MAG: GntR family transcriptional regulator [Alsobacter sp.]
MRSRPAPPVPRPVAGVESGPGKLGFRPLYAQVRDSFVQRLVEGAWQPGQMLPSELELAAEIGVSQGTVRKALDALASERLLVRRQGRGTFVAEHDEARILFQFFKLRPDSGERSFPESRILASGRFPARQEEREALALAAGAEVVRIERIRLLAGRPVLVETLALPEALFGALANDEVPNNLYGLYATRFGITVSRAREKLKAIALDPADASVLGVAEGTPALLIDRLALSLEGTPVEWRVSRCLTADLHYLSDLS